MSEMTPNQALNQLIGAHGSVCRAGLGPCRQCDKDQAAIDVLREIVLEQPVPAGEVTRSHREAAADAVSPNWSRADALEEPWLGVLVRVAQLLATREQAAYERGCADTRANTRCLQSDMQRIRERLAEERGRESAQGGWVAPPELHGVAGYLRAELVQFGGVGRRRVARALELLEPLLPPPPSDPSKGGGA